MKVSLAILSFWLTSPLQASEGIDLLVPGREKAVYIRVEIAGEQEAPIVAWNKFLDQLFDHFDRNGDGFLTAAEVARIFPLPGPDKKLIVPEFAKMSANPDGMVSRTAFKSYYRAAGFTPTVGIILPSSPENARLNETLFVALDRNGDSQLSKEELEKAVALMKRFDADENDVLTPNEILGGGINIGETQSQTRPIQFLPLDPTRGIDLRIELRLSMKQKLPQWKIGDKSLGKIPEVGVRLDTPGVTGSVLPSTSDVSPQLQATREFYLSTFRAALGSKPALLTKDTEDEPALQIIDAIFPFADRNGNSQLTVGEVETFLTMIENGIRAQRTIVVNDTGSNLFTLVDENHDGKLDRRELLRAHRMLSDPQTSLKRADLKRQISITVHEERIGTSFGPVRLAAARKPPTAEEAPKTVGPAWFQAMDRNRDGYLSPREFFGSPELFKQFDTNHDGLISATEAESASIGSRNLR